MPLIDGIQDSFILHVEPDVPVQFGVIDYANKLVFIRDEYYPTGDIEKDLEYVKNYYAPYDYCAKYPNKFKI